MPPPPPRLLLTRAQSLAPKPAPRRLASTISTQPPKLTSPDSARSYCHSLLRQTDHASYLLSAFQHPLARDAHIALRAFNIDVAAVDASTTNTTVGRMRLQFWRDAVNSVFDGRPPAEPVAVLLHKTVHVDKAPLSRSFLLRLIAAREQYLGSAPFATLEALEAYAENTYGSLQYLSLEAYRQQSTALDHIGSHIGKAAGVAAVLRGVPLLATSGGSGGAGGAVVLPLDVCAEFGLRQEDVLRKGGEAPGLKDVVFKVATLANDHLITARKMLEEAGEAARGVAFATFLPAIPTTLYLERLEKADFDPFAAPLMRRQWTLPWRAYRAFSTKKF